VISWFFPFCLVGRVRFEPGKVPAYGGRVGMTHPDAGGVTGFTLMAPVTT